MMRKQLRLHGVWAIVLACALAVGLCSVSTAALAAQRTYTNFNILVAIWPQTLRGTLSPGDIDRVHQDMEQARAFYWRNSRGAVNLNLAFIVIDELKREDAYGVFGLSPAVMSHDLMARGIRPHQYDAVVSVAPGNAWVGGGALAKLGSTKYSFAS